MSRKYGHQGYQDKERKERDAGRSGRSPAPRQDLTREERIQRRSLKHAIDREANEVIRCYDCGRSIPTLDAITAESVCPFCEAELHCCRTCRSFDSGARWQCRAEITEAVGNKTKANRCALYTPVLVLDTTGRRSNTPQSSGGAKELFDNLFKR